MKQPDFNSDNYYEILGLEDSCEDKDIKNSYRKLAKQYHPDKNQGDENKAQIFVKINKAYEILIDSQSRKEYNDSLKRYSFEGEWTDYFDEFFNRKPIKGDDVHVYCRLTLEELKVGCNKTIHISNERLSITIKPNTKPGSTLMISGKGTTIPDCPIPGDLYIKIVAKPHNVYKVGDNGDLLVEKEITYQDLILGKELILNTLTSKVKIKIPERSDISKRYRLKEHGLGGDIILQLKLYIPKKELSSREKKAIDELNRYSNLIL